MQQKVNRRVRADMTSEGGVTPSQQEPRTTEFIRTVKHLMVDRDIDNAGELHRVLKDTGANGTSRSRALIYGYFNGTITPQLWFLRALDESFEEMGKPLTEVERDRLHSSYIASY